MECVTGGGVCGDVRVKATGAPLRVGVCHCMTCRKHHGAVFFAAVVFPQQAVAITGEPRQYKGRFFCPGCGSSVFAQSSGEIEIHLGALDDADRFAPTYELWVVRRESWLPAFPGTERHAGNREPKEPAG